AEINKFSRSEVVQSAAQAANYASRRRIRPSPTASHSAGMITIVAIVMIPALWLAVGLGRIRRLEA
ncbi:MAG: hypothetical protein ACM31C_26845, partial [Acidobacteriota bacterium]